MIKHWQHFVYCWLLTWNLDFLHVNIDLCHFMSHLQWTMKYCWKWHLDTINPNLLWTNLSKVGHRCCSSGGRVNNYSFPDQVSLCNSLALWMNDFWAILWYECVVVFRLQHIGFFHNNLISFWQIFLKF